MLSLHKPYTDILLPHAFQPKFTVESTESTRDSPGACCKHKALTARISYSLLSGHSNLCIVRKKMSVIIKKPVALFHCCCNCAALRGYSVEDVTCFWISPAQWEERVNYISVWLGRLYKKIRAGYWNVSILHIPEVAPADMNWIMGWGIASTKKASTIMECSIVGSEYHHWSMAWLSKPGKLLPLSIL